MADESKFIIEAVFDQNRDSRIRSVAYATQTLNKAERNYTERRGEVLSAGDKIQNWGVFL